MRIFVLVSSACIRAATWHRSSPTFSCDALRPYSSISSAAVTWNWRVRSETLCTKQRRPNVIWLDTHWANTCAISNHSTHTWAMKHERSPATPLRNIRSAYRPGTTIICGCIRSVRLSRKSFATIGHRWSTRDWGASKRCQHSAIIADRLWTIWTSKYQAIGSSPTKSRRI